MAHVCHEHNAHIRKSLAARWLYSFLEYNKNDSELRVCAVYAIQLTGQPTSQRVSVWKSQRAYGTVQRCKTISFSIVLRPIYGPKQYVIVFLTLTAAHFFSRRTQTFKKAL